MAASVAGARTQDLVGAARAPDLRPARGQRWPLAVGAVVLLAGAAMVVTAAVLPTGGGSRLAPLLVIAGSVVLVVGLAVATVDPAPPEPTARALPSGAVAMGTNGMAVASLVFGLLPGFWPFAVAFGHVARSRCRRTGQPGAGMALAGLILGYGALALGVVVTIVRVVGAVNSGSL